MSNKVLQAMYDDDEVLIKAVKKTKRGTPSYRRSFYPVSGTRTR